MTALLSTVPRRLLIGVAALVVLSIVVYVSASVVGRPTGDRYFASDTVVAGDLTVARGDKVVLQNGAKLTVRGKLDVSGTLICENGELFVEVGGALVVNGSLACDLGDTATPGSGISIVASGDVTFSPEARVETNGSVQLVDGIARLARTDADLEEAFEEIGRDTCEGVCVGPFVPDTTSAARYGLAARALAGSLSPGAPQARQPGGPRFFNVRGGWVLRGTGRGPFPFQRGRKTITRISSSAPNVELEDLDLTLPPGEKGADDAKQCVATGTAGKDAGRLAVIATGGVLLEQVTIRFGDGGAGGRAAASPCPPGATATGGAGASSGNLKIQAGERIDIRRLTLLPGAGGRGGDAAAVAAAPGGAAKATGGSGGDNNKVLRARGPVGGKDKVEIGSVVGGEGGNATATGGRGSDASECKKDGGPGGNGTATGGKGGDASLRLEGFASVAFTVGATVRGGRGGDASATAGAGGDGGDCAGNDGPGGAGGKGGDADAKAGLGGSRAGAAGAAHGPGGDGGNGGDGCPPGAGGQGGKGNPPGKNGSPGNRTCRADLDVPRVALTFEHVQPGVRSEVYLDVQAGPGAPVTATLAGPAVAGALTQVGTSDAAGKVRLTWTITQPGTYRASGTVGGSTITAAVDVSAPEVTTPTPKPTPAPEVELTWEHVDPGSWARSELRFTVRGAPGVRVIVTVAGPGVVGLATQSGATTSTGLARLTWLISQPGTYRATGTVGDVPVTAVAEVTGPAPVTTATPTPTPTPTRTPAPTATPTAKLTFEHTRPGVQSEVYLTVTGTSGAVVSATLTGPGVSGAATQSGTTNAFGELRLTWVITQFGTYRASGTVAGAAISAQVEVR